MKSELESAILLGIKSGWISTITNSTQSLQSIMQKSQGNRQFIIRNGSFVNCGTAVRIDGGQLDMSHININDCGTAIAASGDALINAADMKIDKCETVLKEMDR